MNEQMHAGNNREWRSLCTTVAQEGKQHRNLSRERCLLRALFREFAIVSTPIPAPPSPGRSSVPESQLFPGTLRMNLSEAGRELCRLHGTGEEGANKSSARALEGLWRCRQRAWSLPESAKLPLTLLAQRAFPQAQEGSGSRNTALVGKPGRAGGQMAPPHPQPRRLRLALSRSKGRRLGEGPEPVFGARQKHSTAPGTQLPWPGRPPAGPVSAGCGDIRPVPPSWAVSSSRQLLPAPTAPAHTHPHSQLGSPPAPILL